MRVICALLGICLGATVAQAQSRNSNPRQEPIRPGLVPTPPAVVSKRAQPRLPEVGKEFRRPSPSGGKFVWVPSGSFYMGCDSVPGETCENNERPRHKVILTKGFWMLDHEVTQAEYEAVVGSNPSEVKGRNLPVTNVSRGDAEDFCRKLTARDQRDGWLYREVTVYRLPTEAEWQYAAMHGSSDVVPEIAPGATWWFYGFVGRHTPEPGLQPVRTSWSFPWGLYDLSGNVWEWCADDLAWYPGDASERKNPWGKGDSAVARGGSFDTILRDLRYNYRLSIDRNTRRNDLGFRVIVTLPRDP